MALQDPQAEPSMEEILASIRRIISEEEQPAGEPVLDLTQHEPAAASHDDDIVFEAVEQVVAPAPAPAPVARTPAPAPEPVMHTPAPVTAPEQTIIAPPTAHAAASSLVKLAGSLRIAETSGQTVEGVVRELLKPMLKDWLDKNLPGIVESRVEAELERIARLAR